MDCLAKFGVGGAHPGGLLLTKKMLSDEEFFENTVVLDAGCGTGQTAEYLADTRGCEILAVDNNPLMIEKAVQRLAMSSKKIRVEFADIQYLPYKDESVDIVLSESVISFTNPDRSIAELTRVLKKRGSLYAIEMVLEHPVSLEEKEKIMQFYGISQLWSLHDWKKAFIQANLYIQSIENPILEPNIDNEYANDFVLSDSIEESDFDMLNEHLVMLETYKNQLGFRIFKCKK